MRGGRRFPLGEPAQHGLFAGFPGLVSKLWLADDERGRYRGLYEWDGPQRAEAYARALWRVLGLRRDEVLERPQVLADAAAGTADWWRLATIS